MNNLMQSVFVIARRDFTATVYARSFILFLMTPILVIGFMILATLVQVGNRANDTPRVAIAADSATVQALSEARSRLAGLTSETAMPRLTSVAPAQDLRTQARALIADQETGYSAVFSGTLEQPILSGPERIDEFVGKRMTLIVQEAQRSRGLGEAAPGFQATPIERDVTGEAAGNLREVRTNVARFGQFIVFFFTLILATMLLSNIIEEKSNKVIEVLAAAVPLDAIFFGKLLAMLAVSLLGIAVWAGMFGLALAFSVQILPEGVELPSISPAIGWPIYALLLPVYYTMNYLILGALFMGIGGQASSVRDLQSLNMPITFMQMGVFILAITVVNNSGGWLPWVAYVFPFSSPLAMIAEAGQSADLWPHLLAIPWQALWVFLLIRISAAMFRKTVLKSGGETRILPRFGKRAKQG